MTHEAKRFIKRYGLTADNLSYDKLADISQRLGYKIIRFRKFENDEDVQTVIDSCGLQEDRQNSSAFTYVNDTTKLMFLREHIGEDELIHYMLHELGHIWLGHLSKAAGEEKQEREADEFAVTVKLILNHTYTIKTAVRYALCTAASACIIFGAANVYEYASERKGVKQ